MRSSVGSAGLVMALLVVGCSKGKGEPASTGSAAPSAPPSASPGAPAQQPQREPTVAEALRKAATCPMEESRVKGGCAANDAWQRFQEVRVDAPVPFAAACAELLRDPEESVRVLAARCVADRGQAVAVDKGIAETVMAAAEAEKSAQVRLALATAASKLDLGATGHGERALGWLKAAAADGDTANEVTVRLIGAVMTAAGTCSACVKTVMSLAKEHRSPPVREAALAKLTKATGHRAEVCKLYGDVVASGDTGGSAYAIEHIAGWGDRCKDQFDRVVKESEKRFDDFDKNGRLGLVHILYLKRFMENPSVSAEQKKRVADAARKLADEPTAHEALRKEAGELAAMAR